MRLEIHRRELLFCHHINRHRFGDAVPIDMMAPEQARTLAIMGGGYVSCCDGGQGGTCWWQDF
jgi:hypothetical protein